MYTIQFCVELATLVIFPFLKENWTSINPLCQLVHNSLNSYFILYEIISGVSEKHGVSLIQVGPVELYYPVQVFKAPSCGVENQRINKNNREKNKKRRSRKREERVSEETKKNMYDKKDFISIVLPHLYFSQVSTTYEYAST
jgi:hypothetical protein